MEEVIGQDVGKGCSPSTLSPSMPLFPQSPHVHQPRSSLSPVLLGFYGDFITQARLLNHWPLVIKLNLQSLPPLLGWGVRVGLKVAIL